MKYHKPISQFILYLAIKKKKKVAEGIGAEPYEERPTLGGLFSIPGNPHGFEVRMSCNMGLKRKLQPERCRLRSRDSRVRACVHLSRLHCGSK